VTPGSLIGQRCVLRGGASFGGPERSGGAPGDNVGSGRFFRLVPLKIEEAGDLLLHAVTLAPNSMLRGGGGCCVDDVGGRSGLEVWMSVGGRGWILCVAAVRMTA